MNLPKLNHIEYIILRICIENDIRIKNREVILEKLRQLNLSFDECNVIHREYVDEAIIELSVKTQWEKLSIHDQLKILLDTKEFYNTNTCIPHQE